MDGRMSPLVNTDLLDITPAEVPGCSFSPIRSIYWLQTVAPTGLTFYSLALNFQNGHSNLIVPGLSRGSLWRLVLDGDTIKSAEELIHG